MPAAEQTAFSIESSNDSCGGGQVNWTPRGRARVDKNGDRLNEKVRNVHLLLGLSDCWILNWQLLSVMVL